MHVFRNILAAPATWSFPLLPMCQILSSFPAQIRLTSHEIFLLTWLSLVLSLV